MSAATAPASIPRVASDFLSSTSSTSSSSAGQRASVCRHLVAMSVARAPSLRQKVASLEPLQVLLQLGGALRDEVGALEVRAGTADHRHGDAHDGKVLEPPGAVLHLDALPLPVVLVVEVGNGRIESLDDPLADAAVLDRSRHYHEVVAADVAEEVAVLAGLAHRLHQNLGGMADD